MKLSQIPKGVLFEQYKPTGPDTDPEKHKRIAGLWNRFLVKDVKGYWRGVYKSLNPFRLAPDLLSAVINSAKRIGRIGTGQNPQLRRDFERLMHAVSAGQIKTGKEFNAAKNDILEAHGLRKMKTLENTVENVEEIATMDLDEGVVGQGLNQLTQPGTLRGMARNQAAGALKKLRASQSPAAKSLKTAMYKKGLSPAQRGGKAVEALGQKISSHGQHIASDAGKKEFTKNVNAVSGGSSTRSVPMATRKAAVSGMYNS